MTWLRPIDRWFAEKVFAYQSVHRAYARRLLRDRDDAEDLVQEAYARLFQLDNWSQIANPHAFTMRILHNGAMERFRRADVVSIEQGASLQALDPVDEDPGPDAIVIARAELKQVAAILASLPDRCGEAVRLRRIEGLSPKEVAEKMDISVSTVEKHLTKGLRLLFDGLAKQEQARQAGSTQEWVHGKRRGRL
jgi:RNA polymerase sigma factor (sigma-70 family)